MNNDKQLSSKLLNSVDVMVGSKLRRIRATSGQTINEVADAVRVSDKTVDEWERGRQRINAISLARLVDWFDVPVSYFFSRNS